MNKQIIEELKEDLATYNFSTVFDGLEKGINALEKSDRRIEQLEKDKAEAYIELRKQRACIPAKFDLNLWKKVEEGEKIKHTSPKALPLNDSEEK